MGNVNSNGSNSVVQHFTKTYTTFSGVDITALFDNMTVMTLQGLAISITREKVPVYTFGKARAVSISRGKRGIAGTLQFVLFDRDALYNLMVDKDHYYYAHADEVNWLTNTMNPAAYIGQQRNVGGTSIPGLSETEAGTQTYDAYNAPAGGAIVGVGVSVATPHNMPTNMAIRCHACGSERVWSGSLVERHRNRDHQRRWWYLDG
jgi:hypothetical protein